MTEAIPPNPGKEGGPEARLSCGSDDLKLCGLWRDEKWVSMCCHRGHSNIIAHATMGTSHCSPPLVVMRELLYSNKERYIFSASGAVLGSEFSIGEPGPWRFSI